MFAGGGHALIQVDAAVGCCCGVSSRGGCWCEYNRGDVWELCCVVLCVCSSAALLRMLHAVAGQLAAARLVRRFVWRYGCGRNLRGRCLAVLT